MEERQTKAESMSQVIVNESPFDQFTLVHGASGVLAHAVGMTFGATLISGFLWDYLIEPRLLQLPGSLTTRI